jgi:ribose 5-phosphate isomerase B
MTIFIGADHRGFEAKNLLMEYLQEKNIRVEDMGDYEYIQKDDYVDFSQKVAEAVLQNPSSFLGIVICGSGVGVSIAANRYHGIRCALGFEEDQIRHARQRDHVNMLALAADYFDAEELKKFADVFIETSPTHEAVDERRIKKIEDV